MSNNGGEITAALKDGRVISAPFFSESPNARSKTITTASGPDTFGTLNQHLSNNVAYQVGVHDDKGQRRTMEDAYSFVVDFASVRGQGYFAVFDGHAGKYAAEWCGQHFHEHLLDTLRSHPSGKIPDILNQTFHSVDSTLSAIASRDDKMHSGCTAVTAFLRIEDRDGRQSFLPSDHWTLKDADQAPARSESPVPEVDGADDDGNRSPSPSNLGDKTKKRKSNGTASKIASAIKSTAIKSISGSSASNASSTTAGTTSDDQSRHGIAQPAVFTPPQSSELKRVLYTANAGDARAVLCRGGKAVRLTYDHKGTDKQEAKRIMDAGGFVLSGRVNGVLAVTRSLGDSSMKEFVVGSPYTTETELTEEDEFLILACDGLWDVASDQEAVEMVRNISDAQDASRRLVEHALRESTDNITVLVIRFLPAPAAST